MDQATQQNAALVEQSAAAAENLKDQARALVQSVSVFRLEPHENPGANESPAVSERRGPNRASNVTRPAFNKAALQAPRVMDTTMPQLRAEGVTADIKTAMR